MCALMYKPINRNTLSNYWNDMDLLETLIEKKEFREEQVVNNIVDSGVDFRVAELQNPAYLRCSILGKRIGETIFSWVLAMPGPDAVQLTLSASMQNRASYSRWLQLSRLRQVVSKSRE